MRIQWIPLIIALIINIAADYYIFQNLAKAFKQQWVKWLHGALSAILLVYIIVAVALPRRSIDNDGLVAIMWMLYSYFTFYVPKYIAIIVYWVCRIPCYLRKIKSKIPAIASVLAGIFIFINMWWGVLVTRYDYNIEEVTLQFDNLPDNFDGYRITQFSDLHVGTFGNSQSIPMRLVEKINALKPDLIVFTGDIVNNRSSELIPFIPSLRNLEAKDGIVSILGNHDYGDYAKWKTESAKRDNLDWLVRIEEDSLNWRLLRNEHFFLKNGNDSIAIIGVENWGEPPFSTHGDLNKAYPDINDKHFFPQPQTLGH